MEDSKTIKTFEELEVWQEAQKWAVEIYKLTKVFPKNEVYGLTSQIRRAVVSISANIAEGFGRSSARDKLHFYVIAYGSALETKNFLYLAEKLGYIETTAVSNLVTHGTIVQKLLNAFMRPLK